jgi:hypothetical protein
MLCISLRREKLINYDLYRSTGPKLPVEKRSTIFLHLKNLRDESLVCALNTI